MATNRCFDSFNTVLDAGERSSQKRDTAIYNEIRKNVTTLHTGNPIKKNGFKYNQNSIINPTCDISSGYVSVAGSFELRNNIKQGAELLYPQSVSTPKYETWCGNLYAVEYTKYGVKNVVQADASFSNIIIDPSYLLFYSGCDIYYENINKPEQWTSVVDLSFQNTFYAREANNTVNKC
jgi:hypothetical protein